MTHRPCPAMELPLSTIRFALDGARADLHDADQIIALMAQDLNDMRREGASVTQPDLLNVGWQKFQVRTFYLRALEAAFRSYCETAPTETVALQAFPFLAFDAAMKDHLAGAPAPDGGEVA